LLYLLIRCSRSPDSIKPEAFYYEPRNWKEKEEAEEEEEEAMAKAKAKEWERDRFMDFCQLPLSSNKHPLLIIFNFYETCFSSYSLLGFILLILKD